MNGPLFRLKKCSQISTTVAVIVSLATMIACGRPAAGQAHGWAQHGIPDDWTHHRAIFSNPGAERDSINMGRHDHWLKVVNSQRYQLQQAKHDRHKHRGGGHPAVKIDWSMDLGSGATVGDGQYPIKFSFSTTSESCSDWVAYNTGVAGASGGQANIVAYSNLYTGTCSGTTPTVLWAYASGSGKALTSPIVSLDGTKIAFIENSSAGAVLRIIRWQANEGTASAAVTPHSTHTNTTAGSGGNTAWSACTAGSCMISVAFQNGQQDTISAPFYDYDGSDTLWVGDSSGNLHKFTGVFSGTPAEVVTGWPVNVVTETTTGLTPAPTNPTTLTGPVYDGASTLIFVGDGTGYLHSVTSTGTPTISTSAHRMACDTSGFVDPPIVDSTTEEVYMFVGYGCSSPNQAYINRFTASTTNPIASQNFGDAFQGLTSSGSSASVLRAGSFDNTYLSGAGTTGNLYVCAAGALLQVPLSTFTNPTGSNYNVYNTPVSATTACSPVTEFDNGSTDWVFMTVDSNGNTTANGITCTGACMYNYNVTNSSTTSGTPTYGLSEAGGTSGIIIDNNGAGAGESQVYFSTLANQPCPGSGTSGLGTGGCAIQTAQTGPPAAATPVISPNGGTFTSAQTVTITDSTPGSTIFYSTGSGFVQYTAPFTVASSETVQAYADAAGFTQSATASAVFTINSGPPPTVTVTPRNAGLTITQSTSVKATTSDGSSVNWTATGSGCSGSACGTFSSTTSASGTAVTYTAPATAGVYTITATSTANSLGFASATIGVTDLTGMTTYHNDLSRDGVNAQEYALTASNVASGTFGKVFSCAVDGNVYAQPLWMANLTISGAMHNVVLVATENDSLYAFDADKTTCTTLWHANLIDSSHGGGSGETAVPFRDVGNGSGNIQPVIGITGTPVIDPSTDILYVVTKSINSSNTMFQRIHAINLLNGNEAIAGSPVTMAGTYPTDSGSVAFVAKQENQRPGLALVNGVVYVAYAAHEDANPWYGWVFGYSASTLARTSIYNTTPNGSLANGGEGGIWMGGGAPAADSSGNLYVVTGNGVFDANSGTAPNNDYGDSFLQLSPSLTVLQYFTPDDQQSDFNNDKDVGAGGATVVVDLPVNGSHPNHLLLGGGKDQILYLVNRALMGGYSSTSNSAAVQTLNLGGDMFATPAYWNGSFYFASSRGKLQQYTLNMSIYQINTPAASSSPSAYSSFFGATPSITTNPTGTNAIVWALDNGVSPPVVHAYNATNLATEYWNSSGSTGGNLVKFSLPTVANGKVYVGTSSELDVYGLLP